MTLLSDISADLAADRDLLPDPADPRLLELGLSAWNAALAEAEDAKRRRRARAWSATPEGDRLLAALFGNSSFLSGVAVAEWDFLTRLIDEGADALFEAILAAIEAPEDSGEDSGVADAPAAHRPAPRRASRGRRRTGRQLVARTPDGSAQPLRRSGDRRGAAPSAARARGSGAIAPVDPADPEPGSGLIVLGMGKLGGRELNYSSDIDLILLYDPASPAAPAPDSAQSLFGRLARDLVRILDERTGDGYVFRTDLRLRPDPRSTPLAMSVPAALTYYESVGQNWERAALIKARPVAGDRRGAAFLAELQPFIWRRHLDFAAIQDIHSIKRQINAHHGGGPIAVDGHDIKIGRGGIREIEFFAQTQQLIWGGRMPALRVGPTCEALRALAAAGRIDAATADELIEDYRFLRRVEHRLQMVDDAQTHRLPADRAGVARLAAFLGYPGPRGVRRRTARPARLGREALCRAVRGGAEPRRPRQPGVHRHRGRPGDAGDAGAAGLRRAGGRSPPWCAAGITAASARRAASGRASS